MERKLILYAAASLDGYLADRTGGVSWLDEFGAVEGDKSYEALMNRIDTVLLGWNTYRQIAEELSPGNWPYQGLQAYVLTHREQGPEEGISFYSGNAGDLVRSLRKKSGKDLWLCGGADLIRQLLEEDLIDEFQVTVMPVLLGQGIPLFRETPAASRLTFQSADVSGEMLNLIYTRRERA